MPEFIDTHSHIYDHNDFGGEEDSIINNLTSAGISHVFMPNTGTDSIADVLAMEARAPEKLHPLMGLHPEDVDNNYTATLHTILQQFDRHRYYGVGEVGIDLYWEQKYKKEQMKVFEAQTAVAVEKGLPLIIHCRNGFAETVEILRRFDKLKLRGIFHSFTGTADEAETIFSCGDFLIGVNGIVTFKKSEALRKVIKETALEKIVLETDSPYLSPEPLRGKRNESANIPLIAQKIAEIKDTSIDAIATATTKNARELFQI